VPETYAPKATTAPPPGMTPIGMCHVPNRASFALSIFGTNPRSAASATSAQASISSQSAFLL
jgi:hypothetical protein